MQSLMLHFIIIALPVSAIKPIHRENVGGHGIGAKGIRREESSGTKSVTKTVESQVDNNTRPSNVGEGSQSVTSIVLGSRGDYPQNNRSDEYQSPSYKHRDNHSAIMVKGTGLRDTTFRPTVPYTIQGRRQSHYLKTRSIHPKQKEPKHRVLLKDEKISTDTGNKPKGKNPYHITTWKTNNTDRTENLTNTGPLTPRESNSFSVYSPTTQIHKLPQNHKHIIDYNNTGMGDISSGVSEEDFQAINSLDDVQQNLERILKLDKGTFDENKSTKTRGNIVKVIDHTDNMQDAYADKGFMSDDTFEQVDNADEGTLSDYFSAIDKGANNQQTFTNTVSQLNSSDESFTSAPNVEGGEVTSHNSDFYEAIDQGKLFTNSDQNVAHLTTSVSKTNKGNVKVVHPKSRHKMHKSVSEDYENVQKENKKINLLQSNNNDAVMDGKPTNSELSKQTHSRDQQDLASTSNIAVSVDEPEDEAGLRDNSEVYHSSGFGENHISYKGKDVTAFVHPHSTSQSMVLPSTPVHALNNNNDSKTFSINGQSSQFSQKPHVPSIRYKTKHLSKMHLVKGSSPRNSSAQIQNGLKLIPQVPAEKVEHPTSTAAHFHLLDEHLVKGPVVLNSLATNMTATITGAKISGGQINGGLIQGGHIKSGFIEGGIVRGGRVEGGRIKNGTMEGGTIINGLIEGGVIQGGAISDGIVIKGGIINGTVTNGEYKIHVKKEHGNAVMHNTKILNNASNFHNLDAGVKSQHEANGTQLYVSQPNYSGNLDNAREGSPFTTKNTFKPSVTVSHDNFSDKTQETSNPDVLSFGETASRFVERKEKNQMLDYLSFGVPIENVSALISKMKDGPKNLDELVNIWNHRVKDKNNAKPAKYENRKLIESDRDVQTLNPTKPRSSVTRHGNDKTPKRNSTNRNSVKPASSSSNRVGDENLKPTYHWSLDELIGDRIPGSPGAAMITHGKIKSIRGGLSFNGYDAWIGGGDFAGGCISDPDRCADGLSFEMTLKLGADALRRKDISYIVDSGASTFTSKGFTLYIWQGNLRADIAIANKEYCLKTPVNVDHWQDVLITWRKEEGMSMYVNCQLMAQTTGDEHCFGCHTSDCHVTDTNTRLMIGRPNFSPHFHCSNFESGDITFWERYLWPRDITSLCRSDAEPQWPLATIAKQQFTPWSVWSACSRSCGYGRKVRRRSCLNSGLFPACTSQSIQYGLCYRPCTVDVYGDWSAWTSCDRTCGGGAQVRTRLCNKRSTLQVKPCRGLGPSIQVRRCNRVACLG